VPRLAPRDAVEDSKSIHAEEDAVTRRVLRLIELLMVFLLPE
jgi:hypothetical protein